MKMRLPVVECDDVQRKFWSQVLTPVIDLICSTADLHEKMFTGGGLRAIIEIKSGVPRGTSTSQPQAAANQERKLLRFDMNSVDEKGTAAKGTGATAMMQLLEYVPDIVVSGDITGEQLYQAIYRKVNGNAGALLPHMARLGEIRKLESVKRGLSKEDRDLVFQQWNFKTDQMCQMGAIRIPFTRVTLSSKPNRDAIFSDELRIACGGGSPDVNLVMALKVFRQLQESLRRGLSTTSFTFDVKELFEQSPEARFWREELNIPFY